MWQGGHPLACPRLVVPPPPTALLLCLSGRPPSASRTPPWPVWLYPHRQRRSPPWPVQELGAKYDELEIPEDMKELAAEYREKLVEQVCALAALA